MKITRVQLCLLAVILLLAGSLAFRQLSAPATPGSQRNEAARDLPSASVGRAATPGPTAAGVEASSPESVLPSRADALAQTAAFTDWLTTWRRAETAAQPALMAAGRELAIARRAALKHLIQTDPRLALELAVPVGLRRELPAEVETQLERRIDARGNLEVSISCLGLVTRIERVAVIGSQRYEAFSYGRRETQHTKFGLPLHGIAVDEVAALADEPFRMLDDGEKQLRGLGPETLAVTVGSEVATVRDAADLGKLRSRLIAAESGEGPHLPTLNTGGTDTGRETPPTAANTPWINGAKRVLWVQVDFVDDPGAVATPAEIEVTNARVSEFYAANSQGKTTMSFTILPSVLRLPREKSVYNASSSTVSQLQGDAAVLAKAYDAANGNAGTYDPDRYDRWIVLFKKMPAYVFAGQAQLSGPQVRMNGGISPGATYHELGHTQGLSHSHYWLPSGTSGIGTGTHVEYGDPFDAMGNAYSGPDNHFNAAQKAKLGYLEPDTITTVTQAGTYRIARHDHKDAAGLRALKIAPADVGYEYWVEHRRSGPTAFNTAQMDRLRNGVLLHWGQGKAPRFTSGAGTYLIDATAGSAGIANDAPYRIGETFIDPDAGVTIKPLTAGGTSPLDYIDVQVAFGAIDGNRNPTLQADLPASPLLARTNIIFNASGTDPDGDSLYFKWDFGDNTLQPNLNSITRRFAKGGAYSLRVSVHDGKGGIAVKTLGLNISDPLVEWTRRSASVTTQTLYGVVHATDKFVAVGDNSTILNSTDGLSWTRVTAPSGQHYRGIAHNGARFAAAGIGGTTSIRGAAAYSDDGVNWTSASLPAGVLQISAIAHGAGLFVAVGEQGRIYTSADGVTWSNATSPVTALLRSIAFAKGLFVVGADGGRVLTSPDGITWTNNSLPTTSAFLTITQYNDLWHAASATSECYTSANGSTWTRVGTAGRSNTTWRTLAIAGVLFGTTTNGGVTFAEDIRSWTTHQIDTTSGVTFWGAIDGAGQIVIVGTGGRIYTAALPARVAAPLPIPTLRNEADSLKVAVGKKNILAANGAGFTKLELYANGTKVSEINGTAGALSWTPAAIGSYSLVLRGVDATGASVVSTSVPAVAGLPNWLWNNPRPTGADLRSAVRVGNKWWVVGYTGAFFTLDDNGTLAPLDFPTTQHLTGIAYANGRFLVSGPYYDSAAREEIGSLWTSTDGFSWTPLLTTVFDNFNLNFVAFAVDKWITASTAGLILSSTDGINWTRRISGVSTSLRSAAFGNGLWVMVGNSGRILTSPDGTTWTARTSGVTTDLSSVAFNNGTFVAVGSSGVILASTDGAEWTARRSGVTGVLNGAGFVKGSWVVVGDTAGVLTSTDTITWTPASMEGNTITSIFVAGSGDSGIILGRAGEVFAANTASAWRRLSQGTADSRLGLVYAGGRFVAVGQTTDPVSRATVVPVSVSTDGINWTRAAANPAFANLNDVTYGQRRYVAVGDSSRIFTSADAVTWTQSTIAFNTTLNAVAAGPDMFVAASAGGSAYSSPDGITWTQRATGSTSAFRSAAYGNGRFVLVGDAGRVVYSADGASWTAATSGVSAALQTVVYFEDTGFLAAGDLGTMINSSDGIVWRPVETGIADSITAIAQTRIGLVAAAGSNGTVIISLDGSAWTTATLPSNRTIRGLATGPASLVAVGDSGTSLTFEFIDTTPAPVISGQPLARSVVPGASVTFSVEAQNTVGAVYQWYKNGVAISGANTPAYVVPAASSAHAGTYTVTITSPTGVTTSSPATLSFGGATNPGRLVNLSILTTLADAADSFTFGMVVGGTGVSGGKALLVRAVGPSLEPLGVVGVLADPKLEFFSGATKVGENDNWGGAASTSAVMAQVGAFPFAASNSRDAAISLPSLASGANSAKISGTGAGTVLAELYDATPNDQFTAATPRLVNVSVLKHLGTGVTAGFVVGGSTPRTVLVRAIGPTLGAAPFNVPGVVADPQLALFAGQSQIGTNDNWGGTGALSTAFAQVGAFALAANSRDAALLVTLQPGSYTAQVSGVNNTTGIALVEVYEVP